MFALVTNAVPAASTKKPMAAPVNAAVPVVASALAGLGAPAENPPTCLVVAERSLSQMPNV